MLVLVGERARADSLWTKLKTLKIGPMAQPIKVPPTDDLSCIPAIHLMERKN